MSLKTAFFILILMCIRYFGFGTITLKDITATVQNGSAMVEWTTSAELNNKKFIIERSADCINFEIVGCIKGETNSTTEKHYCFTDINTLKGISYYRVTSVDNSENASVLKLLSVDNRSGIASGIVFPCPFRNELNMQINEDELPPASKVVIYGPTGREIYRCDAMPSVKLDLSMLTKGTYYITVENEGKRVIERKILKQDE